MANLILLLFAAPLWAVAGFIGSEIWRLFDQSPVPSFQILIRSFFAVPCGFIALALTVAVLFGKEVKDGSPLAEMKESARRKRYGENTYPCETSKRMFMGWFGFLAILVIFTPALLAVWKNSQEYFSLPDLLFPIPPLWYLGSAVITSLRWQKFGDSTVLVNRTENGIDFTIRTKQKLEPQGPFSLTLLCDETKYTGSGKSRTKHVRNLWREQKQLPAYSASNLGLYVRFSPPETLPSSGQQGGATIAWKLEATAPLQGLNYTAHFIVPFAQLSK